MPRLSQRFEQRLARELSEAESLKAAALAILFTLGMLNGLFYSFRIPASLLRPGTSVFHLCALASVGGIWALVELAMCWATRRRIRRGQEVPSWWGWALGAFESSLTSLLLLGATLIVNDPRAYSAPGVLLYAIVLVSTALRLDARLSLFCGLIAASSHLGLAYLLFQRGYLQPTINSGMWLHIARAFLILLVGGAAAFVAHQLRRRIEISVTASEERSRVVSIFGRYLNDDVVEVLLNNPQGQNLGGTKCEVSLLMTDLRGFSTLSERLPPERVVLLLNHYLGAMTEVIGRHRGTIDEFIGDAILVIFGAPLPQSDHATRAVRCALEMQLAMAEVNAWNRSQDLPEIEMGVGVHSGAAVVGNIGSAQRQKYGVIGATVNLTSRIESHTVGGQILISAETAARIGEGLRVGQAREIHAKGSKQPTRIFDVEGLQELQLPPLDLALAEIDPLLVRLRIVEGKSLSATSFAGQLLALSERGARLRCSEPLTPMQNLAVELGGGFAFAKVQQLDDVITLRFTDWDEAAKAARIAACAASGRD